MSIFVLIQVNRIEISMSIFLGIQVNKARSYEDACHENGLMNGQMNGRMNEQYRRPSIYNENPCEEKKLHVCARAVLRKCTFFALVTIQTNVKKPALHYIRSSETRP